MFYLAALKISIFFAKLLPASQADCDAAKTSSFFGLPVWYKYLPYNWDSSVGDCRIGSMNGSEFKALNFAEDPTSLVLVGFAAVEVLLRVAGLIAVGYVIYGGIQYITSQGNPDTVAKAKNTVINAIIGLAITVIASSLVAFLGNRFG